MASKHRCIARSHQGNKGQIFPTEDPRNTTQEWREVPQKRLRPSFHIPLSASDDSPTKPAAQEEQLDRILVVPRELDPRLSIQVPAAWELDSA